MHCVYVPLCSAKCRTMLAAVKGAQLLTAAHGGRTFHPRKEKTRWNLRRLQWHPRHSFRVFSTMRHTLTHGQPEMMCLVRGKSSASLEGFRGSAGVPSWQSLRAGHTWCVIYSWARNKVRQETDKWPCLVNTAVISAVITQQMGTWRNLYPCPCQSWRASGNRSCGGDCVCSHHLCSSEKQLSVWCVSERIL